MSGTLPIKEFMLRTVLFLPLAFFIWFYVRVPLMWPSIRLADQILPRAFPSVIAQVQQEDFYADVLTQVAPSRPVPGAQGRRALLTLTVNPLMYSYGFALFLALAFATPLSTGRRLKQITLGAVLLLIVVPLWGTIFDTLKQLQIEGLPDGVPKFPEWGAVRNSLVALGYQMGYLILPSVGTVAFWILMNRPYIESLVGRARSN